MPDTDTGRGLHSSGSGSMSSTLVKTVTDVAHREGYAAPPTPDADDLARLPSSAKALPSNTRYAPPEPSRANDPAYVSPPTSPETPAKLQLDEYRREHRFQSLGGAFRPLTSSESGESIASNGGGKEYKNTSTSWWWFGGKMDADARLGRPRARSFVTLLDRITSLGRKTRHRLTSWRRDENSAIAEKKMRDRHQTSLPVYTRWRYKRNYRWLGLLVACFLFFSFSVMPYIDWSLSALPNHFPNLHGDVGPQFHFTQRRLAGSARETTVNVVDRERGFKRRLRKAINTRVAQSNKALRHDVKDGLLRVNMSLPVTAHPIKQLIRDAKEKWDAKNAMQSRTLKQAVAEYKRRNRGLNPPKGFDKWWRFVVENKVPLVDEYDSIMRDIYIFHAFPPSELNRRIDDAMQLPDTFTLSLKNGNIRTRSNDANNIVGGNERIEGQINLLQEFGASDWIPDCRAVYSLHDTPQSLVGYEYKMDLEMRVDDREYYDPDAYAGQHETAEGWANACPYTSNARTGDRQARLKSSGKHFVADVKAQSDLCLHPYNIPLHGVTSGKRPLFGGFVQPVFSLSKTTLHSDILAVPVEQWVEDLPVVPWADRTSDKLLWRGSNTGMHYARDTPWQSSHRIRAINMTRPDAEGFVDVLPPALPASQRNERKQLLGDAVQHLSMADTNKNMFDVAFAGPPIQCDVEDGTCQELEELFDFTHPQMSHHEALKYKYVLDIDGNSWSARFSRLLAGGALVFKSTIMPEWWADRIQPWIHYVPIQLDYSDLHDTVTFFRGDANGQNGNDRLASEIAASGRIWFKTHWRRVDMAAYTARLYLEWARLLAPNRRSMDFVYSPEMEMARVDA